MRPVILCGVHDRRTASCTRKRYFQDSWDHAKKTSSSSRPLQLLNRPGGGVQTHCSVMFPSYSRVHPFDHWKAPRWCSMAEPHIPLRLCQCDGLGGTSRKGWG
ncbi:hypothetical protein P691DRAFT_589476 [Macrolepiota fuliginosa MF-IS2]|uniref:Uncharacterized protein n=1 Tax=Macrolepiota fuliginosa MF-IS2 TaxID=1400762 RepID=A0A9P5X0U8_9AGAR|nr:hypothetical protein P691DRAFT_589476 [Macrolepiota fuliginosa MF-IS2]